jgi:alpha-L-fucosidase
MKSSKLFNPFLLLALSFLVKPGAAPAAESEAARNERMAWFREARFGLFIHWGVYSVPAGEWKGKTDYAEWFLEETKMPVSQYEKFAAQFNPVKFNAAEWVRMAKDAGMRYIVITSKHHDGFGMFRSEATDWCIKSTPFQRDPLMELFLACKEAGLKLCFYHSIMDWHHPDWGTRRPWNDKATGAPDMDRYTAYMKSQLHELLTRYGPIGILWFDGQWESPWTHERGVDLYEYVRSLQPNIIINNRVGKARAGMSGMDQGQERVGDYGTPEQEIPPTGFGPGVDWESCMTMNNHWGYNKHDQNWKSAATLIHNLVDCASKGGNYLLNIGPTSEGVFPDASIERLAQTGKWMKVNGEAIYGTQASPFRKLAWGRCTQKPTPEGATLYLHVFTWPGDGKLLVPGLKNRTGQPYLLADASNQSLAVESGPRGLTISLPATAPDPISSTVVLPIVGAFDIAPVLLAQDPAGALILPAAEASTHGQQIKYESGSGHDNIGYWFDADEWVDWQYEVTKPGKFEVSAEIAAPQAASFEITLGDQKIKGAAPVTGDYTRFQVAELGTLEMTSTGPATLAVRAVKEGWQPINLRCVRLKPVQ